KNHNIIPIPVARSSAKADEKTIGQLRGGEMRENKIIFTGPVGVGKTTAIAAISDEALAQTDASASDMTLDRKRNTTVAMDYGAISLDEDTKVHLYGTPGQERFNFMWEI
ncbi:ATP/GTP-binding protein, partial [Pseudomonas aeruginosa]|uniref:GTP-binding protein n=1 Tax=Pseudomonas aeruginosa TaxID=287 RepID=UPI00300C5B1F